MGYIPFDAPNHFQWYSRSLHEIQPPYGEQAMKERVRLRDLYLCRDCSMTQEEHVERYGESLPVHHIHARRDIDKVERSHLATNLITLCNRCHQYWDPLPAYLQVDAFLGPYLDFPLLWSPNSEQYCRLRSLIADYGSERISRMERRAQSLVDRLQQENTDE